MLTSLQNPLVKQIKKLHDSKHRRQTQCFLLEGTHLLQEAASAQWPLETLCYTEAWQAKEPSLLERLKLLAPRAELVSDGVLAAMTTTVSPDGVMAIARSIPQSSAPIEGLPIEGLGLVLDGLQDPGNVGTILRTAAAAGVERVLLSGESVDLENPKVLRASSGAWFRVSAVRCENLLETVQGYRNQGFQVVATTPKADLDYWSVDYTQPTILLVGNEGAGLSEALLAAASIEVRIPLSASIESLNAAIATALVLFEVKRQRSVQGEKRQGEKR
ncbi:MAG: RNA methyltransferase [Thermosynechococcaceae cyanobacterium MS004]|nr:RNA methyltransferase [Thermosynechococcaceae cyanobacterium MS004]